MALNIAMLENWYTKTIQLKHAFAGTTPPTPIPLPSVTTIDGLLEGLVKETSETVIAAAIYKGGKHDSVVEAYNLKLPGKIYQWDGVKSVGGKTVLWSQVLPELATPLTGSYGFGFNDGQKVYAGHKYLFKADGLTTGWLRLYVRENNTNGSIRIDAPKNYVIDTMPYDGVGNGRTDQNGSFWIYGNMGSSSVTSVQAFDLTALFGAGNEPTTIEEFEAVYPDSYYAMNLGELLSAGVTKIDSKDPDGVSVQSYTVPAEVQALTGYGLSCPSAYNYIDFVNKKYIQTVGSRAYAAGDESDSTVITDGTTTHYKLGAEVETDISEYVGDEVITDARPGGTITFENQIDEHYKIPVPVLVEYIGI